MVRKLQWEERTCEIQCKSAILFFWYSYTIGSHRIVQVCLMRCPLQNAIESELRRRSRMPTLFRIIGIILQLPAVGFAVLVVALPF